jgi:Bacterial protein of unknown function (DUF922)
MFTQLFISFFLFLNPFMFASPGPLPGAALRLAPATEDGGIVWQAERRLSWEDFQSEADLNEPLHAMTSTNIEVQAKCSGNLMQFEVKCVFKTKDSWSKNKQSERLLAHEQMHFDLTEVHARRLRQKLAQTPGLCGTNKARFSKIVEGYFADWKSEQDQYDHDSKHGLDEEQQLIWENKIARQLEVLSPFAFAVKN